MRTIAALSGVLTLVSAFAATSLIESNSGVWAFIFFAYCTLIVIVQFIPPVLLFISMVKVTVFVISESFAVQKETICPE